MNRKAKKSKFVPEWALEAVGSTAPGKSSKSNGSAIARLAELTGKTQDEVEKAMATLNEEFWDMFADFLGNSGFSALDDDDTHEISELVGDLILKGR